MTDDTAPASPPRTPDGSHTARLTAQQHATAGRHTHLITDGETECVSDRCNPDTPTCGGPAR